MTISPSKMEQKALEEAERRAILVARNKEQARAQLLAIQLILSRRPTK